MKCNRFILKIIRDDHEEGEEIKYEGYLTKFSTSNSVLKRWFKLIQKDFYCNFLLNFNNRLQN
jgi:hypothetical protein